MARAFAHAPPTSTQGPAVTLDFVNGAAIGDSRITTTRAAGGATYFDKTGTLQLASANTQRIDYGPIPGTYNWVHNSVLAGSVNGVIGSGGAFPTTWNINAANGIVTTVIASGNTSGLNYVDVRFAGTTTNTFYVATVDGNGSTFCQPGQVWTESIYMALVAGSMTNITSVTVDLRMSTPFDVVATLTSSLTRFAVTATNAGTNNLITPCFSMAFASGVAIDITIRFAAPQLELSSFAGPYVPTSGNPTGTSVTNWMFPSVNFYGAAPAGGTTAGVILNAGLAPDGTNTMMKLVPGTATSLWQFFRGQSVAPSPLTTYTHSVYFKAAGYNFVRLGLENTGYTAKTAVFNLSLGTIVSQDSGALASITAIGNSVYRCSVTATTVATSAVNYIPNITVGDTAPHASGTWAGDGSSGVLVWGQQVETGSTMNAYVPTSGAIATVGATSQGLLVEEARTNTIVNPRAEGAVVGSAGLPDFWSSNSTNGLSFTVTNVSTENGIPFIDLAVSGTSSGAGSLSFTFDQNGGTATASQKWTSTFYARLISGTFSNVTLNMTAQDDIGTATQAFNASPTSALLALQRQTYIRTTNAGAVTFILSGFQVVTASAGLAVSFTIRIGAPQLELGAFATSPILPVAGNEAVTTRAVDVVSIPVAGWFNPNTWTWGVECVIENPAPNPRRVIGAFNSQNGPLFTSGVFNIGSYDGTTAFQTANAGAVNTIMKMASNFKLLTGSVCLNGGPVASAAQLAVAGSATGYVLFGDINPATDQSSGWVRRVRYWRRALSNGELIQVTT